MTATRFFIVSFALCIFDPLLEPRGEAPIQRRFTHFPAAAPSPYSEGLELGGVNVFTTSASCPRFEPTSTFQPLSTVSTHSVSLRIVKHGTPSQNASFCKPPESVSTRRADPVSDTMSTYPTGSIN